jgi:predicted nucleotidyltransferase
MESFGNTIRKLRNEKGLTLRAVAGFLNIDQAVLSKLECGKRQASFNQVVRLADYFNVNTEKLIVEWLSDKLLHSVANEEHALKALQVAEEKAQYMIFKKIDRNQIIKYLISVLEKFKPIKTAWIFGSFSRGDDNPKSDIDIVIEADENFSYFDLAEIQFEMEKLVRRKVDIGFFDSLKPYIKQNAESDLQLIYEG